MDPDPDPDNVKQCMRCSQSLDTGYSSRWTENKEKKLECKEVICFFCDKKESIADYMKTNIITTHLMMDCMMAVYDHVDGKINDERRLNHLLTLNYSEEMKAKIHVQIASIQIQKKIKEFETKVWFKGLQNQILAINSRGYCAKTKKHNNFCVLTYTICARTMITIEDDEASVTCIADETSKESRTGLHGIRATGEQALALIDRAIALYENGTLKFEDDKKVSIFPGFGQTT